MKKCYLLFRKEVRIEKWKLMFCLFFFWVGITSCQRGFDDSERFSSGVSGVTLESPEAENITFTKVVGTTRVVIAWPVVIGAGGYQFSLYIVDDPDNPVVVGEENEVVDGCSVARDYLEETKYLAVIKTLGNAELNNKEALSASEADWSTYLPATVIPDGTNLTDYFAENPIEAEPESEIAYELLPGGSYTISGEVKLGLYNVTFYGDKILHPTLTYGTNGQLLTVGGGITLKYIDFDCSALASNSSKAGLLNFGDVPEEILGKNNYGIITNPVQIISCNIKGINRHLININGKKYALHTLLIKDCIVELNTSERIIHFNSNNSLVSNMLLYNNTFYAINSTSANYLIQAYGRADQADFASCTIEFVGNTFYRVAYKGQIYNGNSFARSENSVVLTENLFIDTGKGEVNRRISMGSTVLTKTCLNNCYWYDGVFPSANEVDRNDGDKSGTAYGVDPGFKNTAGDFTVNNGEVIDKRSGDPRWLPAQ